MGRVGLDLRAQAGVPQTDESILTASENVFRAAFGVPRDVYGSLVILERVVQRTREGFRASGRSHEARVRRFW